METQLLETGLLMWTYKIQIFLVSITDILYDEDEVISMLHFNASNPKYLTDLETKFFKTDNMIFTFSWAQILCKI